MKFLPQLALLLAVASCSSTDEVEWVDYGEDPMQNPQYMEDMAAAGTPGPQHERLASHAGSWKVEGQMWMAPGAEPMPMNATAAIEVLLGGRTIVEDFKSDFMGEPFEGRLIQGFDNVSQRYWSLWTDNMSTGYWMAHGTETSPGQIELKGTAKDIFTPKGRPVRMTVTTNDDGTFTTKMFDSTADGEQFQSMELHYSRG
jgi:hypothetical protein